MLQINGLTYRIAGKDILEKASLTIPTGHKVGLVGRNGAGKSTLFKLISGELDADDGDIYVPQTMRLGQVAQEAPDGPQSLLQTVLESHHEMQSLEKELENCQDAGRISEIHEQLDMLEAHSAESRAASILAGLGFDHETQKRPCNSFSGGWRMRVALACTLFIRPDILLLDEPTNYLDLEGVMWLENFVRAYPSTVIVISHDRDLLNKAVNHIAHLDQMSITLYTGSYDDFERLRREKMELQKAFLKKQEAQKAHLQKFVDRFRYKASKAKQAQSRIKMLEKMESITPIAEDQMQNFHFPDPGELALPIVNVDGVSVGYEADKAILKNLNMRIDMDDRIALLGQNGNGKSTYAKLISGRLDVMSGDIRQSTKLKIGYFAQHQTDELNPQNSAYDHLAELMKGEKESAIRARLGAFGFSSDKADTAVAKLSGGEKARLLFALISFDKPHLMIMDEPTNHLDMDSRQALMQAINEYQGAVILISHDPYLIESCADRLWLVDGGTIRNYDGDMADYRKFILSKNKPHKQSKPENKPVVKQVKNDLSSLSKEIEKAEQKVEELTAEIAKYDRALTNPKLYDGSDPKGQQALEQFTRQKADLENKLETAEENWMMLQEKLENG